MFQRLEMRSGADLGLHLLLSGGFVCVLSPFASVVTVQEGGCRCSFTSLTCVIVLSFGQTCLEKIWRWNWFPPLVPFTGFLIARVNKALCKFGIVCFCGSGGEATVEM